MDLRKIDMLLHRAILCLAGALVVSLSGVGDSSAEVPESVADVEIQQGSLHAAAGVPHPVKAAEQSEMLVPYSLKPSPDNGAPTTVMVQIGPDGTGKIVGNDSPVGEPSALPATLSDVAAARQDLQVPYSLKPSPDCGAPITVMVLIGPDGTEKIADSDSPGGEQTVANVAATDENALQQVGQIPDSRVNPQEGGISP
jgi:hypothetical protein